MSLSTRPSPGRHRAPSSGLGPAFSTLWLGQAISQLGDYIALITIPTFVAFEITDNELFFGIVTAAESLPALLFGFASGVLVDRVRQRQLMILTDLIRAGAFLVLGMIGAGQIEAGRWEIVAIAFLAGTMVTTFYSALNAIIPRLVDPSEIGEANSRLAVSQQVAFVVGPALGGVVIESFGFAAAFFLNTATFLVSAITLAALGPLPLAGDRVPARFWAEAREGFAILWGDTRLRHSAMAAVLANFVVGFIEATFVLIGIKVFGYEDGTGLSTLFIAMGVGGIVGAIAAPRLIKWVGLGRVLVVGMGLYGIGFAALTYAAAGWQAYALLFIGFGGLAALNVSIATLRQTATPPAALGRVTSLFQAFAWSALPVGALVWTALAGRIGLTLVARTAPLLIIIAAIGLLRSDVWTAGRSPA
ncbi:MAG: MFS transporter [Acidimicrobiia bacterium]|nr:MFS transporter [Acidimicrobiia bacterium]